MTHGLWYNLTWVFSGVGVAAIGVIYKFFRKPSAPTSPVTAIAAAENSMAVGSVVANGSNISQTFNNIVNTAPAPLSQQGSKTYSEEPSVAEILEYVASLPVYQRRTAAQAYKGLAVNWVVAFHDVDDGSSGSHDVTLVTTKTPMAGGLGMVRATVDIERYPRLKIMRQGEIVRVRGVIDRISELGSIYLNDAQLDF